MDIERKKSMAYTPHTWRCGELVTDDDMNRIEEGIQEALDCCNGYSCEDSYVQIYDGTVETVMHHSSSGDYVSGVIQGTDVSLFGDRIRVTFDGEEYICPLTEMMYHQYYGATIVTPFTDTDWSEYPFSIYLYLGNIIVSTPNVGVYNIKIEEVVTTPTTSECFDLSALKATRLVVTVEESNGSYSADKSYSEIERAILHHKDVVVEMTTAYGTFTFNLNHYSGSRTDFTCLYANNNSVQCKSITIISSEEVSYDEFMLYPQQ